MKTRPTARKAQPRILRREESLSSRQYRGICASVIYECDGFEIVRIDMEPRSVLDESEITNLGGVHVVIAGSPTFHVASHTDNLVPGDSIALDSRQRCTVSNPTTSRSSMLSLLFKTPSSCRSADAFGRGITTSVDTDKEVSK